MTRCPKVNPYTTLLYQNSPTIATTIFTIKITPHGVRVQKWLPYCGRNAIIEATKRKARRRITLEKYQVSHNGIPFFSKFLKIVVDTSKIV